MFFLALYHGIHLSLRHLKRLVKNLGIKRRRDSSDLRDVFSAEYFSKIFSIDLWQQSVARVGQNVEQKVDQKLDKKVGQNVDKKHVEWILLLIGNMWSGFQCHL